MDRRHMRVPAMLLVLLALAAASPPGPAISLPTTTSPPSMTPRAPEKVYATTCGYCHGGNVGPVIRGRALPPEMVLMIVRSGRNGMPAFRHTEISDAELSALASWIEASKADPKEHGQ